MVQRLGAGHHHLEAALEQGWSRLPSTTTITKFMGALGKTSKEIVVMPGKAVVRYTVPVCPTIAKPPDRTLRKFS